MKTVRDLKRALLKKASVADCGNFVMISDFHASLWNRLNRMSWERRAREPDECDDIDATALVTDTEWEQVLGELDAHTAL